MPERRDAEPRNRRALAVMPHPDDCEILCGGTLLRLAARGWEVHIATMTSGDMGSPELDRMAIARVRREEAASGARALGAASFRCLGFADVEIVFDGPSRHRVAAALRQVDPALVFTTPPDDYMFDHIITSQLVRDACFNAPMGNYATPGREPPASGLPWLYYTDTLEGIDSLGRPAAITCLVDVTDVMPGKSAALACHASQREWLRKHHGVDDYIEAMRRWCAVRGKQAGVQYAEAFRQHRGHPHPRVDLLASELDAAPAPTGPSPL